MFTAPEGGVLRNTNFRPRFFDPAAEKVGLLGLTPHELRHTAASLPAAAGANVKAVQLMLGHASAAMTLDIYAASSPMTSTPLRTGSTGVREVECGPDADQTAHEPADQTELPFENPPEQGTG